MADRARARSFGPTVLAGLAGAGLAAVAGSREWATARGDAAGIPVEAAVTGAETQPVAAAVALVALAAWGVVLVLRGRVRRLVALLGAAASAGALAAVVAGFRTAPADALEAVQARGATGDVLAASLTGWYAAAGVGALLALAAFAVAVREAPRWPAMGSRYDAPAARREQEREQATRPATTEDMWRAIDEGRDPTS